MTHMTYRAPRTTSQLSVQVDSSSSSPTAITAPTIAPYSVPIPPSIAMTTTSPESAKSSSSGETKF